MINKNPNYIKLDLNNHVFINDKQIFVENWNLTILQFCEFLDLTVPRFCYHDKLSIAGNCRMCMVELKSSFKPVIACATSLMKKMNIYINSFFVKQARENVMEFLLINHPLDCPICDQGSECDLQDQALAFGSDRGRFTEIKRSVQDLFMGPVVKTIMTRCIHCTRCVRFSEEVVGNHMLGTLGRGKMTEIGSYYKLPFLDELSGNIVDLCPVGASTSKSYAFRARAWELKSIESIDIFDSLGSNIRVDVKGNEIMRILPKRNDYLNEEWISDKIRFSYEGLKKNRIIYPMLRKSKNDPLVVVSYNYFFSELSVNFFFSFKKVNFFIELSNYFTSATDFFIIDKFFSSLGIFNIKYNCFTNYNNIDFRSNYLLNSNLSSFENGNYYLFDNLNLKKENPVLNSRIKKLKSNLGTKVKIGYIGSNINLNYDFFHISNNSNTLVQMLEGKHFQSLFLEANGIKKITSGFFQTISNLEFSSLDYLINLNINYGTVLPTSSTITSFDLGYINRVNYFESLNQNNNFFYLYNVEDIKKEYQSADSVFFHGTNVNEEIKKISNYILPSSSFFEEKLLFSNLLGHSQYTNIVVSAIPNQFFSINELFLNLNNDFFKLLSIKMKGNKESLAFIKSSIFVNKILNSYFHELYPYYRVTSYFNLNKYNINYKFSKYFIHNFNNEFIEDYYKTDNITLNSETLQKTSLLVNGMKSNFFKNLKIYEYIL
jgi:NADH dehydrogenase (ubiquinone) Fe-S protein 1